MEAKDLAPLKRAPEIVCVRDREETTIKNKETTSGNIYIEALYCGTTR
jgi:hypothetical protein